MTAVARRIIRITWRETLTLALALALGKLRAHGDCTALRFMGSVILSR
jgi:hypothetical protein